jgi:hypothetical protein
MHFSPCPSYSAAEKNNNVHYNLSPPLETPYRALSMHRGDRGTSFGRGGDTGTGPSDLHVVIERGTREENPRDEKSVFK